MKTIYSDRMEETYNFLDKPVRNVTLSFKLVGYTCFVKGLYPWSIDVFCDSLTRLYAIWVFKQDNKMWKLIEPFISDEGENIRLLSLHDMSELEMETLYLKPLNKYPNSHVHQIRRNWERHDAPHKDKEFSSLVVSSRMAFFVNPIEEAKEKKEEIERLKKRISKLEVNSES